MKRGFAAVAVFLGLVFGTMSAGTLTGCGDNPPACPGNTGDVVVSNLSGVYADIEVRLDDQSKTFGLHPTEVRTVSFPTEDAKEYFFHVHAEFRGGGSADRSFKRSNIGPRSDWPNCGGFYMKAELYGPEN